MHRYGYASHDNLQSRRHPSVVAASAVLLVSAAIPVCILTALTPGTIGAASAPGADVSALLAGPALLLAWVVAMRLAVTAAATVLAHLPGVAGAAAAHVARCASPAVLRSLVRVALGASVVAGPAVLPGIALADPGPGVPAIPASIRVLPSGTVPVLDRAVRTVAAGAPAQTQGRPSRATVVVRAGDTLWDIAARHLPAGHRDAQVAVSWPRWFAANRAVIGPDPAMIRPGLVLRPPP